MSPGIPTRRITQIRADHDSPHRDPKTYAYYVSIFYMFFFKIGNYLFQ
jgi:hypothetical protein